MEPRLIAHADWGSKPRKRWLAVAELDALGSYRVNAPESVDDPSALIARLISRAASLPLVVGFDFPIGLPEEYCRLAGINHFPSALTQFGHREWSHFYNIARVPSEVRLHRPFFPYAPGGTSQEQLLRGLGVPNMDALLRACEHSTRKRPAASPLFWTLGPKQVGRAAIIGWRDVLTPTLQQQSPRVWLWPFHGHLEVLLQSEGVVIVETYPAEACIHLGLGCPGRGWRKRSQADRKSKTQRLKQWAKIRDVVLTSALLHQLEEGFGPSGDGEDPFDAVVGLLGIIEVVLGWRDPGAPDTKAVRTVEGWIIGQMQSSSEAGGGAS